MKIDYKFYKEIMYLIKRGEIVKRNILDMIADYRLFYSTNNLDDNEKSFNLWKKICLE